MAKTASNPFATHATGSEAPRSDTPGDASGTKLQPDPTGVSATDTTSQKRGRGRPPKAKSDSTQNGAASAKPSRKPSGRPKRNVAPAVPTASVAVAVKSRVRPKRSNPPPVTASVVTTATGEGSRKRGRPKKDDVAAATVPVAPAKKRGREPNVEVAAAKPVRRTRKSTSVAPVAAGVGDLKKRTALLQKKVKEAAAKLKLAVTAIDEVQVIVAGM